MRTLDSLEQVVSVLDGQDDLYVRWSAGPEADASGRSRDELTGVELPGLSASALAVEPWWDGRPLRLWVARRLYDYRHLAQRRLGARPWILVGRECGRGPDNEPLVDCLEPVAWVSDEAVDEATGLIDGQQPSWGPLDRSDETAG